MHIDLVSSPLSNVDSSAVDAALTGALEHGSSVVHGGGFGIGVGYDVAAQVVAPGVIAVSLQHPGPLGLAGLLGPEKPEMAVYVVQPDALPSSAGYALAPGLGATAQASSAAPPAEQLAAASPAPPASGAAAPGSSSSAASSASKKKSDELAFLDSKSMSIEDKIMRFMAVMGKKADAELVEKMKDYQTKKEAAKKKEAEAKQAKEDDGGGFLGFLGDVVGGIVGGLEDVVKTVGGPLLAAGAAAIGAPFLAPVALKIGGQLGAGLIDTLAGEVGLSPKKKPKSSGKASSGSLSTAKASSGSSSTAKASSTKSSSSTSSSKSSNDKASQATDDGEFDEQYAMLELQRLMQKQERLFSAMSNVMKAIHDGQMVAIHNVK